MWIIPPCHEGRDVVFVPAAVLHEMTLSSKIQKYVFFLLMHPLSLLVG